MKEFKGKLAVITGVASGIGRGIAERCTSEVFTPLMLAQNLECHIVNTASAAGLVVGGASAPYSVTKHAVVALSESLHLTLQQRSALVKVSVLCPGLVRTNIINAEHNRPGRLQDEPVEMTPERQAGLKFMKAAIQAAMPPLQVADMVVDAIKNEEGYAAFTSSRHDIDDLIEYTPSIVYGLLSTPSPP